MGTTAIFAEILIIGLEALAWIVVLVVTVVGLDAIDLGSIAANEGLALLLVIAAAYPLGVIFDRVADSILLEIDPWVDCRTSRYRRRVIEHMNTMRIHLLAPELGVAQFLEYQRSRIRVARGTVFNLFAMVVAASLYLVARSDLDGPTVLAGLLILVPGGLLVTLGLYHVYRRIADAQLRMMNRAYRILILERDARGGGSGKALADEEEDDGRPIVAGVVHRHGRDGVEFLLVQTKDGCQWTFPKGHVKRGETERQAVAREVREESGAHGAIAADPLTTYRYPPTRRGQTDDAVVTAYLVAFEDMGQPGERRRIAWFSARSARAKLAERRSASHAEAAGAVIEAALTAIDPARTMG